MTPPPSAPPALALADPGQAEEATGSTLTAASVGLPAVDFGAPGPLVIQGYPRPLELGMADYISQAGFSKDGAQLIACGELGPAGTSCFVNEGKQTREFQTDWDGDSRRTPSAGVVAALKALREGKGREVRNNQQGAMIPPAVDATWPYAKDITLSVETAQGLRLGGRVADEPPVYSVGMASGLANAIVTSVAGDELGVVGHAFCGEWCNTISLYRIRFGAMAALIYNDTGFRHHKKKDYAASRDLFLKATWANPRASLPPYNLSCAYALLGDAPSAEKALKLAISLGGPKIKARARKDADFKAMLAAPWFKALTD